MNTDNDSARSGILPIFTLQYALRATQDEIGREKHILSSDSLSEAHIEGCVFPFFLNNYEHR